MDCETCREALSARMDGEVGPVPAQETNQHLAGCSACRDWQASALELSRTLRVREGRAGAGPHRDHPRLDTPAAGRARLVAADAAVEPVGRHRVA